MLSIGIQPPCPILCHAEVKTQHALVMLAMLAGVQGATHALHLKLDRSDYQIILFKLQLREGKARSVSPTS